MARSILLWRLVLLARPLELGRWQRLVRRRLGRELELRVRPGGLPRRLGPFLIDCFFAPPIRPRRRVAPPDARLRLSEWVRSFVARPALRAAQPFGRLLPLH